MSDTPTDEQIADVFNEIGDMGRDTFTEDKILRAWYRVRGAANEVVQHEATLALLVRALMGSAAKLVNYRAGSIAENRSDIMKHLRELYAMYKPSLDAALGTEKRQFAKSSLRAKPRQGRTEPGDTSERRGGL